MSTAMAGVDAKGQHFQQKKYQQAHAWTIECRLASRLASVAPLNLCAGSNQI